MEKIRFSIEIHAPKKKVWGAMLEDDSYREWTEAFMPGSHYVGDWSKGSKMLFLAPGEKGGMSGMVSTIKENRPYDYVSIEHLGVVQDGKEDTTSESVTGWAGAHEDYTLKESAGVTEVLVELDTVEEYMEMFQNVWPKALQKLKEVAERRTDQGAR